MFINPIISRLSLIRGATCSTKLLTRTMATKVAVCQMQATNDVDENFRKVKSLIEKAVQARAAFVFLPECCDFVGENRQQTLELSLETGKLISKYRDLAKTAGVWLSLGGLHERIEDTDKMYNCHVVINDQGEIAGEYRKLHLFDVDTPEFKFRESDIVSPGPRITPPIDTAIGRLGLQICYDMRFPETSVLLRKMGADVLTYPSAFAYTTGVAHWEILLRSRAIENQCFVIASAQTGWHNKKRRSYGRAMIVDPWGEIIAETNPEAGEDLIVADIDLTNVESVRKNMPCLNHRRDDVYLLKELKASVDQLADGPEFYNFGGYKIAKGTVFLSSAYSIAFTNIRCVVPGHVLIASKRNAPRLKDLTAAESVDFFNLAMQVQRLLSRVHNASSLTVTVQDGEDAGQTVKHVHCHVMPRHKGDFDHNDMIYTALNRHDQDESLQRRNLDEMVKEAQWYREEARKDGL